MDTDKHRLGKNIRKGFLTFVICAFIYGASYILNSFCGGYWLVPEMDGRDRYSFGLAMRTAIMWQPRLGHEAVGNCDMLGIIFKPLIRLDRRLIHPTIYFSDKNWENKLFNSNASQIHPLWRDQFKTKVGVTATRNENLIRCVLKYSGSDYPREIREIRMQRAVVASLGILPPSGFVEKPHLGDSEYFKTNYVYWAGNLPLIKNQDVILEFPFKQFSAAAGKIVFYYHRTDNSTDEGSGCIVDVK